MIQNSMKRTTLVLDEALLAEARSRTGLPSDSAVVRRALEAFVATLRARRILEYRGSGAWSGDLGRMRGDRPRRRRS